MLINSGISMLGIIFFAGFCMVSLAMADDMKRVRSVEADKPQAIGVKNVENNIGDAESEIAAYSNEIKLKPHAPIAYARRGAIYDKLGRYEEALADYSVALDLKPEPLIASAIYSDRGFLKKQNGELSSAMLDYNKALELDPTNSNVLIKRGTILNQMGYPQGAVVSFTASIELDSSEYGAYCGRSMARAELEDFNGALADTSTALKLSPNAAACYLSFGYVLQKKRDYVQAIQALTKALTLSKSPIVALSIRASVFTQMGDLASASSDLKKIIDTSPSFFRAYVQMGDLSFIEGNLSDALSAYQKAQSIGHRGDRVRYAKIKADLLALRIEQTVPKKALDSDADGTVEDWPKSIEQFISEELSEKELLDSAGKGSPHLSSSQTAEAYFYIGELAFIKGDTLKARDYFTRCVATDQVDVVEYLFAKAELTRMIKQKNGS